MVAEMNPGPSHYKSKDQKVIQGKTFGLSYEIMKRSE